MTSDTSRLARWWTVTVFAIAMAWVEAAVVFYLRTMINRIEPYQPDPLPVVGNLGATELVREAATLVMLLMVGILAGRTWRSRLGYTALAFGFWDIFYYVFLRAICGWPRSLFEWDILFLLPLPWWGPVLAPVSIAGLMIVWGTLVTGGELQVTNPGEKRCWMISIVGVTLALYLFMTDSWHALKGGSDAVRHARPVSFNWSLFGFALVLIAAPIMHILWYARLQHRLRPEPQVATIGPGEDIHMQTPG